MKRFDEDCVFLVWLVQIAICFNDTNSFSFERKVGKLPLEIVSFHVTIQIKINEREICFTKILFPYPLLCLIKVGFESVTRTHLIFDSTSATAGGFKQYNTTVYFMTLFKMSTHDTELWISLGVRVFPEILSLNTFFWTTFYSSNIGKKSWRKSWTNNL